MIRNQPKAKILIEKTLHQSIFRIHQVVNNRNKVLQKPLDCYKSLHRVLGKYRIHGKGLHLG